MCGKQNPEMGFWQQHWFNNNELTEILSVLIPFYIDGDNKINFGTCRYIRNPLLTQFLQPFVHRCK